MKFGFNVRVKILKHVLSNQKKKSKFPQCHLNFETFPRNFRVPLSAIEILMPSLSLMVFRGIQKILGH